MNTSENVNLDKAGYGIVTNTNAVSANPLKLNKQVIANLSNVSNFANIANILPVNAADPVDHTSVRAPVTPICPQISVNAVCHSDWCSGMETCYGY